MDRSINLREYICDVTGVKAEVRSDNYNPPAPEGWFVAKFPDYVVNQYRKDKKTLPDTPATSSYDKKQEEKFLEMHFASKEAFEQFWDEYFYPHLRERYMPEELKPTDRVRESTSTVKTSKNPKKYG